MTRECQVRICERLGVRLPGPTRHGHQQATGGALRPAAWNAFIAGLGFGSEMQVAA